MNLESTTLFMIVTLMLIYKSIDLFRIKEKSNQLLNYPIMRSYNYLSLTEKKQILNSNFNSKLILRMACFLQQYNKELLSILMFIYILILAMVGYATILKDNGQSTFATLVIAISTACISLVGVIANYLTERIKSIIK